MYQLKRGSRCRFMQEDGSIGTGLRARGRPLTYVRSFRVMGMRRVSVPKSINQSEIVSQSTVGYQYTGVVLLWELWIPQHATRQPVQSAHLLIP